MNPLERINEMKNLMLSEAKNALSKENQTITVKEHYDYIYKMLLLLERDLKDAEYNYQVESLNHKVKTFEELTVLEKELNDDVIIFQPVVGEDEITALDMNSLADVLKKLRDDGQIKENILLLPPNINVFRAVLAVPSEEDKDEEEDVT